MLNSLDPDFVGPDLGLNCLQSLSADNTNKQRVKLTGYVPEVVIRREYQKIIFLIPQPKHML